MKKPVILLGSGGHAKVLLGMLQRSGFEIVGVTDPARLPGSDWLGCRVLGGDEAVRGFEPDQVLLVNGIGSLPHDSRMRSTLFDDFCAAGYRFQSVLDPAAFVAGQVRLAAGVQVMAGAVIQVGALIAENCIVNSGAIVDHECRIGRHVHIAPGAVLSGGVEIGDGTHVGTGAVVIQGIRIGAGSIVGAGSVVTKDVSARQIVYPARSQIQDL